ncbi:TIP41-like family-domain-containing protein [Xylariaceae sp. FL0594]|nr:TIP41-like family-domain-containing protein [Xylariaceae sp. FL0594]
MATPPSGHPSQMATPWPSPDDLLAATRSHRQGAFVISSRKLPISKAGPIEALERDIAIPVPEMIFGDNLVSVEHAPSGWRIEFNARDALDAVDKSGANMLQVAYAGEWSASREQTSAGAGIREVVRPFDWSYSTTYRGTVIQPSERAAAAAAARSSSSRAGNDGEGGRRAAVPSSMGTVADAEDVHGEANGGDEGRRELTFAPTDQPIPVELLKRRDPILFYDEVVLYESELDDNGISVLTVKFRVHEQRMLLLCRLYMRLDNVLCRIRDTRVYVDFASEVVTREYTAKEASFSDVKQRLMISGLRPEGITVALRDANQIAELLPIAEHKLERVALA